MIKVLKVFGICLVCALYGSIFFLIVCKVEKAHAEAAKAHENWSVAVEKGAVKKNGWEYVEQDTSRRRLYTGWQVRVKYTAQDAWGNVTDLQSHFFVYDPVGDWKIK